MNVVPLLGNAMIAKSRRKEMSPMIVPFGAIRVSMDGKSLPVFNSKSCRVDKCWAVDFNGLDLML